MPSPSRKKGTEKPLQKPLCTGGSCPCRGRPLLGRAAVRPVKTGGPISLSFDFHRMSHGCTLSLSPRRNYAHLPLSASGDSNSGNRLSVARGGEATPRASPESQETLDQRRYGSASRAGSDIHFLAWRPKQQRKHNLRRPNKRCSLRRRKILLGTRTRQPSSRQNWTSARAALREAQANLAQAAEGITQPGIAMDKKKCWNHAGSRDRRVCKRRSTKSKANSMNSATSPGKITFHRACCAAKVSPDCSRSPQRLRAIEFYRIANRQNN